jgi:hypothetical protein
MVREVVGAILVLDVAVFGKRDQKLSWCRYPFQVIMARLGQDPDSLSPRGKFEKIKFRKSAAQVDFVDFQVKEEH